MVRPVLLDRDPQRLAVEHRKNLAGVGDLHRRCVGVAVAGDDLAAEPLGGNGKFLAELARAKQHEGGDMHESALTRAAKEMSMRRLAVLPAFALVAAMQPAMPPAPPKTPTDVIAASKPAEWAEIPADELMVIDLSSGRRVVIQLAPAFAPVHVANIQKLARGGYWQGAAIYRVQDNYVAQWGNNDSERPLPAGIVKAPPAE